MAWLRALPPGIALGSYQIHGPKLTATVQAYDPMSRELCRFESHVDHIDIQYTITGTEGIEWCPRTELVADGGFANDVQFWQPPDGPVTTLVQSPGRFAIFFPEDAHRPKVRLEGSLHVKKLVIKIHRDLLVS